MARTRPVILDDDDPPVRHSESREVRDGFEWGVASSLLGGTLVILAPLVVLLIVATARPGNDEYSSSHSIVANFELFCYLGVVGAVIFSIVGFFFGRHGLSRARADRTSAALPVCGMLLSLAAAFAWLLGVLVIVVRGSS